LHMPNMAEIYFGKVVLLWRFLMIGRKGCEECYYGPYIISWGKYIFQLLSFKVKSNIIMIIIHVKFSRIKSGMGGYWKYSFNWKLTFHVSVYIACVIIGYIMHFVAYVSIHLKLKLFLWSSIFCLPHSCTVGGGVRRPVQIETFMYGNRFLSAVALW
jgi:hypothetical protein